MSVFIILFRELDLYCNVLAHLHRPILEAVLLMIINVSYFRVYYILIDLKMSNNAKGIF